MINNKNIIRIYPPKRILQKMQDDRFSLKPKIKILIDNSMLSKQK